MSRAGLTAAKAAATTAVGDGLGSPLGSEPPPEGESEFKSWSATRGLMHVILFGAVVDRPAELGAARSNAGWITA